MHAYDNGARQAQQDHWREGLTGSALDDLDAARVAADAALGLTAEELIAEHTGNPSAADSRRFSQAPVTQETASALLGSIDIVEALSTVLDLALLVDDITDEEKAALLLISAVVASAARVIKGELATI